MNRPGTTMIELLIYITISTVAVLTFSTFLVNVNNATERGSTVAEVSQAARTTMVELTQAVRTASNVAVSGNTLTLNGGATSYTLDTTSHQLNITTGGSTTAMTGANLRVLELDPVNAPIFRLDGSIVTITLTVAPAVNAPVAAQRQVTVVTSTSPRRALY